MKILDFFEIYRFIIIGIIAVTIDALVYFLLTFFGVFSYELSKRISFIAGAIFAFFFNRKYVFQIEKKNIYQFLGFGFLYFISFLLNGYSHDVVIDKLDIPLVAFLFATSVSTIINYLGQKFIIFRKVVKNK